MYSLLQCGSMQTNLFVHVTCDGEEIGSWKEEEVCLLRVDNLVDALSLHNVKSWLVTVHCVHTNLRGVRGGDCMG